jgi:hypothetical protein
MEFKEDDSCSVQESSSQYCIVFFYCPLQGVHFKIWQDFLLLDKNMRYSTVGVTDEKEKR